VLSPRELLPEIATSGQADCRTPYVLIRLRGDPNVFRQYDLNESKIQTLAAALDHVVEQYGLDIVFLPFQGLKGPGLDDNQFHQYVVDGMRQAPRTGIRPVDRRPGGDLPVVSRRARRAGDAFACCSAGTLL
jgi:hypothetical protein